MPGNCTSCYRNAGGLAILSGSRASTSDAGAICNTDELLQLKRRLMNKWSTLKLTLGTWKEAEPEIRCRDRLSVEQRAQFDRDYASFEAWRDEGFPLCFANAEIAAGRDHEARADQWYELLETTCGKQKTLPPIDPTEAESIVPAWVKVVAVLGLSAYLLHATGAGAAIKRTLEGRAMRKARA